MSSAGGGGLHADPKGGGLAGGGVGDESINIAKAPYDAFPTASDLWREHATPDVCLSYQLYQRDQQHEDIKEQSDK